ncbi:MAG: type II 3-dehydroquinate dehydratase [Bacteroidales bacterium]|nr:type II 3-dehydroquinate dehydratase [Bacteroidales bacterium]
MKPEVLIINGPNLNLTGRREPGIYGTRPLDDYLAELAAEEADITVTTFQSNHEGALIDKLHERGFDPEVKGIILNAGAYTHTSLALADAIRAISVPVIEVHISNTAAREPERHRSLIAPACRGTIAGFGLDSYRIALEAVKRL